MSDEPMEILLVEDNPGDARLLRETLADSSEGPLFHIHYAGCLNEAIRHLTGPECFEAVLLDLGLPDSQGAETVTSLRQVAPQVPVVVLTGLDDEQVGIQAVRAGAQDYLVKGRSDARLLVRSIRYAVERKRLEEALRQARDDLEARVWERTGQLRESLKRYRSLVELSPDAIGVVRRGRLIYANEALVTLAGAAKIGDLLGRAFLEVVHPDDGPRLAAWLEQASGSRNLPPVEGRIVRPDGAALDVEARSIGISWQNQPAVLTLIRDVSARKRTEQELRRANRFLQMIGACNVELAHAADERELLERYCRIAVEVGGYRFAWVGYAEETAEGKIVRPAARAGFEDGYLDRIRVTWDTQPTGQGPGGRAVRTARPCVVPSIRTDPHFAPWRDEALRRGYESAIALPLRDAGKAFGLFAIYAAEPDAFDADESRMLAELADDLAFGIQALRGRKEFHRTADQLRQTNELLERMFSSLHVLIASLDERFNFIRVNRAYAEADGREPDFFVGKNHFDLYPNAENEAIFRRVVETGEPYFAHEKPFTYAANPERGVTYWDWSLVPVRDAGGEVRSVVLTLLNVTARKQAQDLVKAERQRFFDLLNMFPGFVLLRRADFSVAFANRTFRDLYGNPADRPCYTVLHGRSEPCEPCRASAVLKTGEPLEWERHDEAGRLFRVWGYPFTDTDGTRAVLKYGIDVTERKRLEKEILEISREERRRIGQDLHDVLGQNLAGIAFLSKVLSHRLEHSGAPEADEAREIAALVNQAASLTRNLSHGLCPVDVGEDGLVTALRELAAGVERHFGIVCRFESRRRIRIPNVAVATNLYHIGQEAVTNATRHAHAKNIFIRLAKADGKIILTVRDDGVGIPSPLPACEGMGLRIMRYRADLIGAILEISPGPAGGTSVTCALPFEQAQAEE